MGHPTRWNDKTIVLFDNFVFALAEGRVLEDNIFYLYKKTADGTIVQVSYQGAWVIVDNGYLNWPTTVPPMKTTCLRSKYRFSKWLESVRKDVECTFGILKGRFRILKTGIRLGGQQASDRIFLTCCALHNWLLEVDGLDKGWEEGVASMWQGNLGLHDASDVQDHLPVPLQRMLSPTGLRRYDATSEMDRTAAYANNAFIFDEQSYRNHQCTRQEQQHEREGVTTVRVVQNLSLPYIRKTLIKHFYIAFSKMKSDGQERGMERCK